MSTLKFKSKIEVPGIDIKGGNITGVNNVSANSFSIGDKTVIDEDSNISAQDITADIMTAEVRTNYIAQKKSYSSITIESQEDAPVVADYISTKKVTLSGLNIVQTNSDLQLSNINGTAVSTLLSDTNVSKLIDANDIYCKQVTAIFTE